MVTDLVVVWGSRCGGWKEAEIVKGLEEGVELAYRGTESISVFATNRIVRPLAGHYIFLGTESAVIN